MTNQQAATKTVYQITTHYSNGTSLTSKAVHSSKGSALVFASQNVKAGETYTVEAIEISANHQ